MAARESWKVGDPLTEAEREMVRTADAGAFAGVMEDKRPSLATMKTWDADRTVRGAVLAALLGGHLGPVHRGGVKLVGARIVGPLNLIDVPDGFSLQLWRCFVDGPGIILHQVKARALEFIECFLPECNAEGLEVETRLVFRRCHLAGPLRLVSAYTPKGLSLSGAHVLGRDAQGNSLIADHITVRAGAYLSGGFAADGAVRFIEADISGDLDLDGAHLSGTDEDGDSVVADSLVLRHSVLLRDGFTAAGAIRLHSANVTGDVSLRNGEVRGNAAGKSVVLAGAKIGGNVFANGLVAHGTVSCHDAEIGGQLAMAGAHVVAPGADAVILDGCRVGGSAFLGDGFEVRGNVRLIGATFNGLLSFDAASFQETLLLATGARVEHEFEWTPRNAPAFMDLERMHVTRLVEDCAHADSRWPKPGNLLLSRFTFDDVAGPTPHTTEILLSWIRRQYPQYAQAHKAGSWGQRFASQPYEHLIKVYRESGQETEAKEVAIARRNDLRKYGNLTWRKRAWSKILDLTLKHGYEPWRALALLLGLYVVVLAMSVLAQHQSRTLIPAKQAPDIVVADPDAAQHCRRVYPCFYPTTYALDLVVPILDVSDADAWRPDGSRPWRWTLVAGAVAARSFGWGFTTLAVAGYTGLVRRD